MVYDDESFNPELINEDREIIYNDKKLDGFIYYQVTKYYKAKGSNKKFFPNISEFRLRIETDPEELNTSNKRNREVYECDRKVSGANGKINVNYTGDSGPIKDC